ncbi:MOSC domain-containing protein [Streptomyces calidiresistens]|uniref:MOSC domain-containing protein n=1 Tax=Streptomyces calidiresistens TaxID=1485586 RepID=A0A7W3XY10_9ACTN|nr:MOSC domain-containing protein [Streptomyces calidiresistens]MBB0231458.1 MOSC domain-containing protein [Streptomyces calidiresistens]
MSASPAPPPGPRVLSVNTARAMAVDYTSAESGLTGIAKRPVSGPVRVTPPPGRGTGGDSGLVGDFVGDRRHHGGPDQAVYAFAREDLDRWEAVLGRPLADGSFGENLTTAGIDVSGARIGERWRIGGVLLEVSCARIPCRTFAEWLGERGWVKRFTEDAAPGAYLRVLEPGEVRAGDPVEIAYRPDHEVTVAFLFRSRTTAPELRTRVLAAGEALSAEEWERARARAKAAD